MARGKGEDEKAKRAPKPAEAAPKRTNLGDSGNIKRFLDDAVIKVLLDDDDLGYEEDTALSNVKLVVGFGGVGASLLSHVYPATFPKNWWVLLACCAAYFACSGILQLLLSFCELESILLTRGKLDAASGKRGAGLNIASHFPRFQEAYTLGVTPLPSGSLGLAWAAKFKPSEGEGSPPCEGGFGQREWSVAQFFDDEGFFQEESFENAVRDFLKEYEAAAAAESKKSK